MEGTENQTVIHQDSTEELKDSQDHIEVTEADNKEKEEYSIGASGAQSDEEDEYAINLEEDEPSSSTSSTSERINIDTNDDGWKHLEAFALLDSEATKVYYEQMVYNSWCSARTDDNIRSKMESSKEVLDTEDSMLGLLHSSTDGEKSSSNHKNLRNLLSYRASYYSKKKLVMQDNILDRLEILRRIATECKDVLKDFKENEMDHNKKEMFQSVLPKHVQVGLKMTLRLVMSLMTTVVTKLNAETIIDIIDTLYETLSELPAGCLRDQKNQQIDSVTIEGVSHLRKWMITALATTHDKQLKEKIFKLWYAVAIATGTLDDVLPLLNGLLLNDPSFVSSFPAPLGAELKKLNEMSTKYDFVPRTLLSFKYFQWPVAPDEKTSTSSQNTGMASDGTYLYIHDQRGIVKLGTGYNDTKFCQVHAVRRKWRPTEKGWMFFAAGKLYYRSPDIKPNAFITINPNTLEEEEQIPGEKEGNNVLKVETSETRTPTTSDGRYVYIIEVEKNQAGDNKFKVHKFDPLNKFQHLGVAEMQAMGSNQPIENANILSNNYICNGNRLATLSPSSGVQCRIFEFTENPSYNPKQKDSKDPSTPFIWNEVDKSDAWSSLEDYYAPAVCATTFDYANNSLWIINNNGIIKRYLNEGLGGPKHNHLPAPAFPIVHEHVLSKYPLPEGTTPVTAEQAAVTFLANMQRLGAEWSFQYPDLDDPEYEYPLNSALVIQSDEKSINNLCNVIEATQQHYFDGHEDGFFLKRYALHTYLVLLKQNLFRPFKTVKNNTQIKDRVTAILNNFMTETPKTNGSEADTQAIQAITRAAADILIVTLDLVYPSKEAQTGLLYELLGRIGNPVSDAFLYTLLGSLAHGNKIGLFPQEYEHSTSTLQQLTVLADSYLKEVVKSTEDKVQPSLIQSRALSLLFYYQKWLIQNLTQHEEEAGKKKLAVLATVLFEQAVESLARVIDVQNKLKLSHDGVWDLVKDSVVGAVLPYLVLGLSLTSDPLVTVELIPALSKVAIQLDQLNQQIKVVAEEKKKEEKKDDKKEEKKEDKPSEVRDNLTQIEGMTVWLLAKLAGGMVTGPAVGESEKENSQLISSELFSKGLDTDKEETTEAHFLKDFVEAASEETNTFFSEIRGKALSAPELQLLKRKENPALDRVERYVIAALLKQNGLISLALYHCKDSQDNLLDEEEEEEFIDLLVPLWRAAHKVRKWLIQEIQAAASDQSHESITEEAINKAKFLLRLGSVTHSTPITPSEAISLRRSSQSVSLRQSGSDSLRKSGVIPNTSSIQRWKISVQSLRTWADFFGVWKNAREKTSIGNTVTDDIISVIQSATKSDVFVQMITDRKERAKCRISGFQAFHTLLNIIQQADLRFDILHQLLQGLRSTDYLTHVSAHHFLQDLEGVGQEVSDKVKEAFLQLLDNLLKLIQDTKAPANLRVMALDALNLQFKPQDNQFLLDKKVPELLLKFATEDLGTENNDKKKLQEASWLAFRLLGVQAIESDTDGRITDELLRLLSAPLQRAEQYYQSVKRSKSQKWIEYECIRILQFLITVSSKSQCMEYLAYSGRLTQVLHLVKHGSAKVQLIAFRLLRRVLAVRDPDTLDIILDNKSILDFFLEIIGIAYATSSTLFSHRIDVTVRLTHDIVSIASEAVMLFRHLLKSSAWSDYLTKFIKQNLARIPTVVKRDNGVRLSAAAASDLEAMVPSMAALCLLGGDIDVIRIGGKVMVKSKTDKLSPDSSFQIGTVVEYNALSGTAKVVLDSVTPIKAAEYSSNVLTAIPEIAFEARHLTAFAKELAELFKFFLSTEGSDDLVLLQFKSRSFKILGNFVKSSHNVKEFVDETLLKNLVSFSLTPTKDKPKLNLEQTEKVAQTLQDLLLPVRSTVTARLGWLPSVPSMQSQVENLIADGKLTQHEYEALHLEFTQLDLNGDGEVTLEEFKEANLKRGSKVTEQDMEKLSNHNKLNFLGFMQVIIGKAITPKASESKENEFHLEIKSPLPLAATYKVKECNLGAKLPQDEKAILDTKLVIFSSSSPASVADKLVVLQQDDTLLPNLKLVEQNGAKAIIVIVESELNHDIDNEANRVSIPVAVATASEMETVINYIHPTKRQKSGESAENKESPYKEKLVEQGWPEDQVTSALAKFSTPVLAAAYLVENVKKSKKKDEDKKEDDNKSDAKSESDSESDNEKPDDEASQENNENNKEQAEVKKDEEEEKKDVEPEKKDETKPEEKKEDDKKDEETKVEEKKDETKVEEKKAEEKKEDAKEDEEKEEDQDIPFDSYEYGNDEPHFFQPYEAKDESTWPAGSEDTDKSFDPKVEININNPRGEAIDIESSLCRLYGRHAVVGLLVQMKDNKQLLTWAAQTDFLPQIVKLAATSEDWVSARVNYRNEVLPVVADILKTDTDGHVTKSFTQEVIGTLALSSISAEGTTNDKSLDLAEPNVEFALWLLQQLVLSSNQYISEQSPILLKILLGGLEKATKETKVRVCQIITQLLVVSKNVDQNLFKKWRKHLEEIHAWEVESSTAPTAKKFTQALAEMLVIADLNSEDTEAAASTTASEVSMERYFRDFGDVSTRGTKEWNLYGTNGYSTFVGTNISLTRGKWYYEVELDNSYSMMVGWADANSFIAIPDKVGVGDTDDSWGYCGNRQVVMHGAARTNYHQSYYWKSGDVVGVFLNADIGQVRFSMNDKLLDIAFENIDVGTGLTPALTLESGMRAYVKFDRSTMKYVPRGFKTIGEYKPKSTAPSSWKGSIKLLYKLMTALINKDEIPTKICNTIFQQFGKSDEDQKLINSKYFLEWPTAADEQLITFAQSHTKGSRLISMKIFSGLNTQMLETLGAVKTYLLKEHKLSFSKTENLPPIVILRMKVIIFLNEQIKTVARYINFDDVDKHWTFAGKLKQLKGLLFFRIKKLVMIPLLKKMDMSRSYWSSSESIELNRMLAVRQKEKGWKAGDELSTMFGQFFKKIQEIEKREPKFWFFRDRLWTTNFVGEGGVDQGGLYNESISAFCSEMQSNAMSLFIQTPNGTHKVGNNREKFIPRSSAASPTQLAMYRLVGKMMAALGIRGDYPLPLHLPSMVWKQILGETITENDLRDVDLMCLNTLDALRNIDKEGVTVDTFSDVICEVFAIQSSDGRDVELKENGANIPVTFENRDEWADLVVKFRLSEFKTQVDAIVSGINSILPIKLMQWLTWWELEEMVTGKPALDLEKLKKMTDYGDGYSATHPVIVLFWKVLESFTPEEQSAFLRFTWGRSRLPERLTDQFKMRKLYCSGNPDEYLPKSHTCGFAFDLPEYTNFEVMREKLMYAIHECAAVDGDFNAGNVDTWA